MDSTRHVKRSAKGMLPRSPKRSLLVQSASNLRRVGSMNDNDSAPSTADHIGQAAGGITGVVAGAAIGLTAGPVGILLGGIAGAIGGWWSGRAIAEAAENISEADEQFYREDFDRVERRVDHARRAEFDAARAAYLLGDIAAANPEYAGLRFEDVERDLSRGWQAQSTAHDDWGAVRDFASVGYEHGRERRRTPR